MSELETWVPPECIISGLNIVSWHTVLLIAS